jgi:thioredoxin-related protein
MAAKPVVDGIEREHEGTLTVIRIDIQDPAGKEVGARYGFEYTPTFLLFSAQGEQVLRTVGAIDPAEVTRLLRGP